VAGLEYATGKTARIVGKPSREFFELGLGDMELPASAVAMVGDDIESDIGGAQRAGITGILVKTGKFREDMVADSGIEPAHTIDSIADLPGLIESG
jgi:ribonucleotide monophosphatase NagD (HAD superfamily)